MTTRSLLSLRVFLLAALGCADPATGPDGEVPDDTGMPADTGETGDTGLVEVACAEPQSLLLPSGDPSGYEACADGSINRVSSADFDINSGYDLCRGDEADLRCDADSDCDQGENGRCASLLIEWDSGGDPEYCGCIYPCKNDDDCDVGQACNPPDLGEGSEPYPICLGAECQTGDDCESGECGFTTYNSGCGWDNQHNCRDDRDTCRDDEDCVGNDSGEQCGADGDGDRLHCLSGDCDIGRPLFVDGQSRTAGAVSRTDWAFGAAGATTDAWEAVFANLAISKLSPSERGRLAARWRNIAALEHASVGSFARFTLQLLALGAPPELLAGAQAAAADEVRHAQIAYGLASAYAGATIGPGPMALGDAMPALDAEGVMRALIDEACVGETLGAAEARDEAETLAAGPLRDVLLGIAEDESRHAALAWRTLKWILSENPPLVEVARGQFATTMARHATSSNPVHRAALRAVVEPLVRAVVTEAALDISAATTCTWSK